VIYLITGQNTVTVTLTEKVTIPNPKFVFVFVNDNTGRKVACTSTDLSINTVRYNQFKLDVVTTTPNPLINEVEFDDYGFYHYYIYEIDDATTFDYANINTTDLRTLTGLVETGKAYWSASVTVNYYYKDIRTSIVTYGQ
jgi:hypothetical protein